MKDTDGPSVVKFDGTVPIQGFCGLVRELIDAGTSSAKRLSVALVEVNVGLEADPHLHRMTEEVYFILEGEGDVRVGTVVSKVSQWDSVVIPPGYEHTIRNTGPKTLRLLAINSPPYDPDDTVFRATAPANGGV